MKLLFTILAATVLIATSGTSCAQGGRQRKSPHDTVSTKQVAITYGRPYKNGRVIFGELEKYGKVWRVGADEATEITFNQDSKFGGAGIKQGAYTLFAIPEENEWTIILNSQLKQWGAYGYEKAKDKDVAKFKVPVSKLSSVVEQLTIKVEANAVVISWDQTQVSIPLSY